jgi:hypothetical protein
MQCRIDSAIGYSLAMSQWAAILCLSWGALAIITAFQDAFMNVIDLNTLSEPIDLDPCVLLWKTIVAAAIKSDATEVRYEPWRGDTGLRMKVNGVLYDMVPPPTCMATRMLEVIRGFCMPENHTWRTRWARRLRRWADELDPPKYAENTTFGAKLENSRQRVSVHEFPPPDSQPMMGILLELKSDPTIGEDPLAFFTRLTEADEAKRDGTN